MAERKEEDFEARRQQIIDGALEVFASKGLDKATNRDIARAAGIKSPGLIYHYFRDKAHLYQEVLEGRVPLLQLVAQKHALDGLPLEEMLRRVGRAYLAMVEMPHILPVVRLFVSDMARNPGVGRLFWQAGPARGLAFLAGHLEAAMARGEIGRVDPLLAARQFMGPLVVYVAPRILLELPDTEAVHAEAVLELNIRTFLAGLKPDSPDPA